MREALQTRNRAFGPNGVPTTSRQTSATRTDTTSRLPISLGSTNKRYEPSTHLRPAAKPALGLPVTDQLRQTLKNLLRRKKYSVPILYQIPAFGAFDDLSDFLGSISCETSKSCQVRGSNPCRSRPGPPVSRPEDPLETAPLEIGLECAQVI